MSSNNDDNYSSSGGTANNAQLGQKDNIVRIKRKHICVILNNLEKISLLFGVKLIHVNKCASILNREVEFACEPDYEDSNALEVAANIQVSLKVLYVYYQKDFFLLFLVEYKDFVSADEYL